MADERSCVICGESEEQGRLDRCVVCGKFYCADCAYKTMGRRFCSQKCSQQFYYGEMDDDEDLSDD